MYFAKAPRPGLVKTRLCPPLTPAEAAGVYRGFLLDLLQPFPGVRTLVYGWPEDGLGEIRELCGAGVEVRAQRGEDLFERLSDCVAELLGDGHDLVVVRNTDSPDLPDERVHEALAGCEPGRVVLGPDAGGGFYLLAVAAPCRELLEGLEEGGDDVYESVCARARELGLVVQTLPVHRDVDTYADLVALWERRE